MKDRADLILGTVQFGMAYGVAGRAERPSDDEARSILAAAWEGGVRCLDTAAAYGDIEQRLAGLTAGRAFRVVSKIPAVPADMPTDEVVDRIAAQVAQSLSRLDGMLDAMLFHDSDDLMRPDAGALWAAAERALEGHGVVLGASVYGPDRLNDIVARLPARIAQMPGNAFDQRLHATPPAPGVALHIRSVFLQGLLVGPEIGMVGKVPRAAPALAAWHAWCAARDLSATRAALSVAQALPQVAGLVIGVDDLSQMHNLIEDWSEAAPLSAPDLAIADEAVLRPDLWGRTR